MFLAWGLPHGRAWQGNHPLSHGTAVKKAGSAGTGLVTAVTRGVPSATLLFSSPPPRHGRAKLFGTLITGVTSPVTLPHGRDASSSVRLSSSASGTAFGTAVTTSNVTHHGRDEFPGAVPCLFSKTCFYKIVLCYIYVYPKYISTKNNTFLRSISNICTYVFEYVYICVYIYVFVWISLCTCCVKYYKYFLNMLWYILLQCLL